MAQYWLVKSEPDTYSFDDLVRDGSTVWDGVRNPAAAKHLRTMAVGDEVFFYHSGAKPGVVGLAKVTKTAFPDPNDASGRWVAVELAAGKPVKKPVSLADIKAEPALADLAIVRQGRLSVSPVTAAEWKTITAMSQG
ncbi:MAG TPA: EVE domain-containing protein [Phenylobacterium sp.]|nr:EVE domain-containing protein [Phenylobacterium sp.]